MTFLRIPHRIQKLIRRYKVWRLVPRAKNDHATHVPALATLGLLLNVRSVLEFGSGFFSTLTFLDRTIFPNLTSIHSYENELDWYTNIKEKTKHDERITLNLVEGPLSSVAERVNLADYDLVFIDDARTATLRAETIRTVVRRRDPRNVIVVHDFEMAAYQRAAEGMSKHFIMTAFNPNTGILWDGNLLKVHSLRSANRLIQKHVSQYDPAEAENWHEVLLQKI